MVKRALLLFITLMFYSCTDGQFVKGTWVLDGELSEITVLLTTNEGDHIKLPPAGTLRKAIELTPGKSYTIYHSGIKAESEIVIDNRIYRSYKAPVEDVFNFTPENRDVEIVINYKNIPKHSDYILEWMKIGEYEDINRLYMANMSIYYFSAGLLVICFILFLLLSYVRTPNSYNLFIALFALTAGFEQFFNTLTASDLIVPFSDRIVSAGNLWQIIFLLLFLKRLYAEQFNARIDILNRILVVLSFIAFTPYYYMMLLLAVPFVLFILVRLIRSVYYRKTRAVTVFITMLLYFSSLYFDQYSHYFTYFTTDLSSLTVITVVISMFMLIGETRRELVISVEKQDKLNKQIKSVFSKFVPLEILDKLGNRELQDRPPGDNVEIDATVLFIDIRDFTYLSGVMTPEESFLMINNFYGIVGREIGKHGGYIESYGGDGVKSVFTRGPEAALKAACEIGAGVNSVKNLRIGISIHLGKVVLGTIGSSGRIQTTVVSNVTRLLTGMDHFNSKMGIELLITSDVFNKIDFEEECYLFLGKVVLKGQSEPIDLYQIFTGDYRPDPEFKKAFIRGVTLLQDKKYQDAKLSFIRSHDLRESHIPSKYYLNKLDVHFTNDDGIFVLNMNKASLK